MNSHVHPVFQRLLNSMCPPVVASSQQLTASNDEAEQTPEQIEARFRAVRGLSPHEAERLECARHFAADVIGEYRRAKGETA